MKPTFQQVYSLLPILLHYHHPIIPGYLEGSTPHGVSCFVPDRHQQQQLQNFTGDKTFTLNTVVKGEYPITGIYSMGSTSSVGQNSVSDLDIWVFHESWLDREERFNLQYKCTLLQKWCISMGIEVSFFLIDENRFHYSNNAYYSNSTQHILLLDEFYRTAVRMAGKRILWNIIPGQEEYHYDDYVTSLYSKGILKPNEWLDLGGLSTLSVVEYFDAILSQLCKSINSPYKAVLKTLLLETYSWEYPNTKFLAMDIKQCLHDGEIICFGLDPYCMMLERVTRYLIIINDHVRLDLVRRCFYLKVYHTLSNNDYPIANWRRKILSNLVKKWGWDAKKVARLNKCAQFKVERLHEVHQEFLDAIMQSYQNLMRFAYKNHLCIRINPNRRLSVS